MKKKRVGFALTGSFCTWEQAVKTMKELSATYDILPILSPISCVSNNKFGKAEDWIAQIEEICGCKALKTIEEVEPIGPKKLVDIMAIVPCTGNTLGKLAAGINDSPVTMAAKSNLRNGNPLVLAVSTNDALSGSARNIGTLLNTKNVYFVPMAQDDPLHKPASVVAKFDRVGDTIACALGGRQCQPVYC